MEYSTVDIVLNVLVLILCGVALLNGLRTKEQHVQLSRTNLFGVVVAILATACFEPMLGANLALLAIVVTHRPSARERFTIERIYPQKYLQEVMRGEEEAMMQVNPSKKKVRFSDDVAVREEFRQPPRSPPPQSPPPQSPPPRSPPPPVAKAEVKKQGCYSGFDITLDMLKRAQTNMV